MQNESCEMTSKVSWYAGRRMTSKTCKPSRRISVFNFRLIFNLLYSIFIIFLKYCIQYSSYFLSTVFNIYLSFNLLYSIFILYLIYCIQYSSNIQSPLFNIHLIFNLLYSIFILFLISFIQYSSYI